MGRYLFHRPTAFRLTLFAAKIRLEGVDKATNGCYNNIAVPDRGNIFHDPLAQLAEHLTFNQRVRSSSLRWITSKAPASVAAGTGALFCVGKAAGAGGVREEVREALQGPAGQGRYRQGKSPRAHSEARRGAQRAIQGALRSFYRIRGYSGGKPPAPRQTVRQPVNQHSEERAGPPRSDSPPRGLSG